QPPPCLALYRSAPDTPEPFRKTRDGPHSATRADAPFCTAPTRATLHGSVDARLQSTGPPTEESTVTKGSRTTNCPRVGIRVSPLTNEGG
ncbi:unnamed protein product, partial [Musa acuminata subsp. burmannicoides]